MKELLKLRKYYYDAKDKRMMGYIGVGVGLDKKFELVFNNCWNVHEIYAIAIFVGFFRLWIYREWKEVTNE